MYTGIQIIVKIVYECSMKKMSSLYESIKIPSDCCQPEGTVY